MSWAYQRMLAIAAGFAAKERMPTDPASLVNEAYLRLLQDPEHAVALSPSFLLGSTEARGQPASSSDVGRLELGGCARLGHAASGPGLDEPGKVGRRQSRPGRVAIPGGLHGTEICELRGVSDATDERHLRLARTWLYDRLQLGTT
jgi:hypothetical protein